MTTISALGAVQHEVRRLRERHALAVSPMVALLDSCAEMGELSGAYLKATGYAATAEPGLADERVRAEFGDILFSILSFADAAGLDAGAELAAALARYETRFAERREAVGP